MSKLDDLKTRYPLLFPEEGEYLPFNDWGFECGEGWYDILEAAFRAIYSPYSAAKRQFEYIKESKLDEETKKKYELSYLTEKNNLPVVEQCKSKFGTLRLYCRNVNDHSSAAIDVAEYMSEVICEKCGNKRSTEQEGWARSICTSCIKNTSTAV